MKINMLTFNEESWNNTRSVDYIQALCDCGRPHKARKNNIKSGQVKSCGCFSGAGPKSHGQACHPLYCTWNSMNQRCSNKNDPDYKYYGGRGVKVCERWKDINNFIADLGEKPSMAHTIDRINNDGNYEPSNVRWATSLEQHANKRQRQGKLGGQKK